MVPAMERDGGLRIEYEVFLSFRGADSRETFTDCLHEGMEGAGIHVFRDDDELQVGNYASSKWCLVELTKMVTMASKSDSTKEILPIYLHVNSDDVKLKTPLYHDAFVQHERNFGADQVKVWRDALMEVEEIKRWSLKTYTGYGKLIKEIVQEVLIKLNAGYKNVTEHLVEDHVQIDAIMKLLEVDYSGMRFVGVHGIGGIDKTTLAKVIYNKLYSRFDCYSFLENVQEISRRSDGIIYLQKQLLSSILHSTRSNSIFVCDNDQGIGMIKKALCDKKILIVLDDVEKKEQLEKLVGKSDWFENGSKVIITTRNMSVLTDRTERLEVDAVPNRHEGILTYEVKEMGFSQALQLFCRHSFRRDFPTEDYNILSRQIILILGKLPLAIEVIGSSLSGVSTDKALWEETLKKLQKVPPKEVQETLMISYEGLEPTQRRVFLDIACFFIKENNKYLIFMWSDCEFYPHDAIRVLLLRSLINIGDDNKFSMHDQVRDLGRHIVYEENCRFPGKRSRASEEIEALSLSYNGQSDGGGYTFTDEELQRLRSLSDEFLPS
ncbi:disease resistance protein RUN1-like [Eucalyptus grandis]|uniref:disease resistance protein RUN1-like n=1 Tax=Eucalyptus grandis TaxID=71139 RepID=UPI00192F0181|nr:disease resistance protein RUN1-like [Eucalyptus grandis]